MYRYVTMPLVLTMPITSPEILHKFNNAHNLAGNIAKAKKIGI